MNTKTTKNSSRVIDIRLRGADAQEFENARTELEEATGIPVANSKFVLYMIRRLAKSE